ncbi:MAG: carboxypeptidase regulatory-like domain-containing protein [Candidatus Brockarchaeota archaeon]|nr:carboxypeptidase regulatory-like domain-containing protein [Candidatus Brockarchaeota archaeon]
MLLPIVVTMGTWDKKIGIAKTSVKPQTRFIISIIMLLAPYQSIPVSGESYTLLGSVKDFNGNPLSNVAVTIYDSSGAFITKIWTLANGGFGISLDRGTYRIQLEKKGYESKTITVSLNRPSVDLGEIILDFSPKVSMSQTYLKVESFSEVSIPVSVENKGSEEETVTILVEAPEGWEAGVYSGSAEIVNLTLSRGSVQNLNLKIKIPYSAQGVYSLRIRVLGSIIQEKTVSLYVEKKSLQILTSTYPVAQAQPGSTVVFDLTVRNVLSERLTGTISLGLPAGWTGSVVKSDGGVLYGVSLGSSESANIKAKINVPLDAAPGSYEVTILFKTKDFDSTFPLTVIVVKGSPRLRLRTDTPYVDAYAGGAANYPMEIENTGDSDGVVSISITGLPSGYNWVVKDSSGSVVSKLYVKAGETRKLNVVVSIPPLTEPDVLSIVLEASANGSFDRLNLGLGIVGWYSVAYVTQNFYCETTAGETVVFQVEVKNTGYSSLSNLKLDVSDVPSGFNIKVDPSLVSLLKPQENVVFSLTITSDADISAGDYYATLSLKADQSQAATRSLHIYVKQRGEVVLIGVLIVIIMVGAMLLIYRRYGRR